MSETTAQRLSRTLAEQRRRRKEFAEWFDRWATRAEANAVQYNLGLSSS